MPDTRKRLIAVLAEPAPDLAMELWNVNDYGRELEALIASRPTGRPALPSVA